MSQLTFGAALPPNPPAGAKQHAKQSKIRKLEGLGESERRINEASPPAGSGVLAEFGVASGAFSEQKKASAQKGADKPKKSGGTSSRRQQLTGADMLSIGFGGADSQREEISPSSPTSGGGSVKRERTSISTGAGSVSVAFAEAKGGKGDDGPSDSEHLGSTVDGRFLLPKGEQKKVLHFQEQETMISDDLLKAQSKDPDKTSLCVRMLMDGYVNSFVDFFYLTHRNDSRGKGDGENEKKVDANNKVGSLFDITGGESYGPEPLSNIKENLCAAEAAQRKGDSAQVFDAYGHLADFFQQAGDTKTALYFYQKCVETAEQLGDVSRQASATLSLGLTHDSLGDETSAFEVLEKHLSLTCQLHEPSAIHTAQEHLLEVYRRHSENLESKADYRSAVEFHKKCLELAVKLKDTRSEGMALYRLGMTSRQLGEPKQALDYQHQYLEICQRTGDQTGEGSACAALAQCCQDLGDNASAVKHLDNFLDISTRSADSVGQAEACSGLGAIYTCQGNYKKAVTFYEKAFEIAKSIGDRKLIESTRINVGIASGNLTLGGFMETVHKDLSALLKWKTRRVPIPRK